MQSTQDESSKFWEQQANESEKAFEAFSTYLMMGTERSLAKAAQSLGKSTTLLEEWSRKYGWQARVRAHSRWVARTINEEVLMGTAEMRRRHASTAIALQQRVISRLMNLDEAEVATLSVSQMLAMLKVGVQSEAKAREIKPEEIEASETFAAPIFNISFIPERPPEMVGVRLSSGECGYIAKEAVDRFKADYPDAIVIA